MIKIYDCTASIADYVEKFLQDVVHYDIQKHDNCLYNITFYGIPFMWPVLQGDDLYFRLTFKNKTILIKQTDFSKMEIE